MIQGFWDVMPCQLVNS